VTLQVLLYLSSVEIVSPFAFYKAVKKQACFTPITKFYRHTSFSFISPSSVKVGHAADSLSHFQQQATSNPTGKMLKRVTTVFKKDKKSNQNSSNGTTAHNDNLNGRPDRHSPGTGSLGKKLGGGDPSDGPDHSVNRDGIVATFEKFSQVIQAAGRPLPTGTGDGSYIDDPKKGALLGDLEVLRVKDYETAIALLKQHLSGSELTDDRTMIMEKTIQACGSF
jgi:hypothetical protein